MGAAPPGASGPAGRVERLVAELPGREIERMLVTSPVSVEYLTGFTGTNGACLVGPESRLFLTDPRYREWVSGGFDGWEVEILRGEWLPALAGLLGPATGIEDGHVTVRIEARLIEKGPEDLSLIPAGDLIEGLRRAKDPAELRRIAAASELADAVLGEVLDGGLIGRTEAEVAGRITGRIREEGGEPSFPPIVASGPNSASPHAEPSARTIGTSESVIIDLGAKLDGYCSDCTRTVSTGLPDGQFTEVYELVVEANEAALDQTAAGVACAALDEVARGVIERAGHGDRFTHGLGHGVGLEVHEAPRLGPRSSEELLAGDVVTIEPGIYLPGEFGVRVEDLVVVGERGPEANLSSHPKALLETG